jgi:phosphatidylglycerophosphate synthase
MKKNRNGDTEYLAEPSLRNGSLATAYYRFLKRHLLGRVEKAGLTPNQVSLMGVIFAAAVPVGFAVHPLLGLLFLTASAVSDSLDGLVARRNSQATVFGAFLDDSLDRIADFLFLVGFWVLFRDSRLWLPATLLTLFATGMTLTASYIGLRASLSDIRCPTGIFDRSTRTLYLIAWAGLMVLIPGARTAILWMGLVLFDLLLSATVIHRIFWVRRLSNPARMKNI